jgi:16S rRNA (adenine1518-N6/adenine1519-N6)-dimethyltransferase
MAEETLGPPTTYDLTNLRVVRDLARHYQVEPRKSFSQHWLVDRDALDAIVAAGELTRATNVLEVGAGMGVLTLELARRAGRVVAVELERDVLRVLRALTKPYPNVEILNLDLLKIDPGEIFGDAPYRLLANLPYAITALALRHFLEAAHPPERIVVLVQREVAERIVAKPGEMSLLALSVQFFSTPRLVAHVPARSFSPPPEVDSAILALESHPPLLVGAERARLFVLAKLAFAQRRKQLHNILPGALFLSAAEVTAWLAAAGITPDRRPQTLSLAEWVRLAQLEPRGPRNTSRQHISDGEQAREDAGETQETKPKETRDGGNAPQ